MKRNILTILLVLTGALMSGKGLMAQQWTTTIENVLMLDGCITEDNTVLMVGRTTDGDPFDKGALVRLSGDGQYELAFSPLYEGQHVELESVLPLPDGGYFVVGKRYTVTFPLPIGELLVLILDDDMNVLDEQTLQAEDFDGFAESHSVMDDDGSIVVMAAARRPGSSGGIESRGVLFRFSQEGELLQYRYLVAAPPAPLAYMRSVHDLQLMNDPFSDRIAVLCPGQNGIESVLLFDHGFNLLEDWMIADPSIPDTVLHYLTCCYRVEHPRSDYWYNENEMLVSAHQHDTTHGVNNHPHVLVGRMNLEGEITEKLDVLKQDTLLFAYGGMAYADDTTVYVAARCHTRSVDKPYYPHVYLLSTELELLGRLELWSDLNHHTNKVFATTDGGCILAEINSEDGVHVNTKFGRFSRSDFHPISFAVKEMPSAEIQAKAFPNPAKDELNIHLAGLSGHREHRIRIVDIHGRPCLDRIIRGEGNVLALCVADLPTGIYTYSVYCQEQTVITGKFMKE